MNELFGAHKVAALNEDQSLRVVLASSTSHNINDALRWETTHTKDLSISLQRNHREMECTGGAYMSAPINGSTGVKRSMQWGGGEANPHLLLKREPVAPFAVDYRHNKMPRAQSVSMVRHHPVGPLNPHRPASASVPRGESDVTRHAPYASRKQDSMFYSPSGYSRGVTHGSIPSYSALNDPLLTDYFRKKFMNPTPPGGAGRPGSGRPSSANRGKTGTKSDKAGAMYKIAVTTADKKNAGTDARVYIRIIGTKGKLPKTQLAKKAGSVKKKKSRFKFNKGTTHIFKEEGKDIGDIVSIVVEHDGLTKQQGWYLEQVEIVKRVHRTGKEKVWVFQCQQWLSLHEGDCQISREIYSKISSKTEYEIVVVTGDQKGGGTNANVSITLFGKTGQTQKLPLKAQSKSAFERGHSDIFKMKSACVGPMTKIRIQHDNLGLGAGWYLDRVVVTDLMHPKWKYYFPCGQWLAKDEGDGLICRDLVGSRDPLAVRKANKYKVSVYTGDKRGAGTDANVFITLFGDIGESGEKRLDTSKNNFERGKVDEFFIECPCLGSLNRARIGHDNAGLGAAWYLDKVIVDDMELNRVYEFPCDRWLAKDEDDGALFRDLVCAGGPGAAPPGVPYTIEVRTGDVDRAGTSARVYCILYGGNGGEQTSGKIWLDHGKFNRGRTDIFNVEVASSLSPLSRIEVGHDNAGAGAGWFLDRVMVKCPSAGVEQWFLCDKWFAADEGDGLIERTLYESKDLRKDRKKMDTWHVSVYTSDTRGAGTDANVWLVAYGKTYTKSKEVQYRKSDEIKLENKGDNFEAGEVDKLKIEMDKIGTPYKIRIGHDNSGSFAGWHLDRVEMINMMTNKTYFFKCNRWLATDEEDGSIIREIPAEGEDIKKKQPLMQYVVAVHTGTRRGAGTDANVFLNIFGEQGDTGERPLTQSKTNKNKFERGNVDEFVVEAVRLKQLKRIRIGHDGANAGAGWFLDKVTVRPSDNSEEMTVFECNRWLDMNEDDGLIVREITAGGSQMLSTTSYHVSVKTGDIWGAGTDANVYCKIFGSKGDTGTLQMKSADNNKNKFERNRTDLFKLEAADIGKILKVRIGHDGSKAGSGWFLDELRVDVPSRGEHYLFACHRWLDTKEDDGQIELELEPTEFREGSVRIPYEVTVWTGDINGAGTDANVFLQMYGENGKTEEMQIRNRTDNFEQAQVDKFKIEADDIGPLLKVRIGHDGKGMFAGWFMDKLLIQRHPTKTSKKRKKPVRRGSTKKRSPLSDSEDEDGRRPGSRQKSRAGSRAGSISGRPGSSLGRGGSSKYSPKRGGSRLASASDDTDTDSDMAMTPRRPSGARSASSRYGGKRGSRDDSDDEFERGSRKGKRPASAKGRRKWEEEVEERDERGKKKRPSSARRQEEEKKGKKYLRDFDEDRAREKKAADDGEEETEDYWFVCQRWFAKSEDDGLIVRELLPTDEHGNKLDTGLQEVEYTVKVHTGDKFGAGTDANVLMNLSGEYGDTGERELKSSNNTNKWERNQVDEFKITAVELGTLKKVKIRHDNKGGGAAWYLGHVEVYDPISKNTIMFPCDKWLATKEGDGQISRELVPISKKMLKRGESSANLEIEAAKTTYNVHVFTGDHRGAGTDANVHIHMYGDKDDTGPLALKTSKTNRDKFERNKEDVFELSVVEIGELKKIKISHDNSGAGGDWFLERVEIDCPKLGRKWYFQCGRWLAKGKDDGQLERELYPQDVATEEYIPCISYEITTHTSDRSSASTDADVYLVLYGKDLATSQKSLCSSKAERKSSFKKGAKDTFIVELEDVGETIEKLRIGHDGKGFGSGWHLEKVEIRRLIQSGKTLPMVPQRGSELYVFKCDRWLARDEEDGAIERELVATDILEETVKKDGSVKTKKIHKKGSLISKKYTVNVYTGDVKGAGTDANVYVTIFGDQGDTGERKLVKSETNRDKFERGQLDIFQIEAVDLGNVFKCRIRHDNSMLSPAWFLDKVEVIDTMENATFELHCERWLAKNKDDCKIERSLYVKGYEGAMSSTSTMRSHAVGSVASLDSLKSTDPFSKSPRLSRRQSMKEDVPDGPTIPYSVKVITGPDKDNGTDSPAWIKINGPKKLHTGKMYLELAQKKGFEPGSIETFSIEAFELKDVKSIEVGHDGVTPGSGWFLQEVEIDLPTKGKHYFFTCKTWLARDKGDGRTSRIFSLGDSDSTSMVSYKPMVPYEATFHTGDESGAGTDSQIFIKVFGAAGATSDMQLDKLSERFERGRTDLIKMEIEDVTPIKKIRIGHNGKGTRPDWYLEKVELRNMNTGDLSVFKVNNWFSASKGDGMLVRDVAATVKGKTLLKPTSYKIHVKTSDVRGAGTDANVYIVIFGENGDSGQLNLKESETNKSPFEKNQQDVFVIPNLLTLGQLIKVRIWHDNKGLGASWHLSHLEIEDESTHKRYSFPCNRWLSKSEDDKQIVRELSCANMGSPDMKEKVTYEIEVTTSDKQDAGMMHNAWLVLVGEQRSSKEFMMTNSARNKILRRGQTDTFTMTSRNLGSLEKCILGAVERDDKPLGGMDGREAMWHCHSVVVKNNSTGDKYTFPCKNWVQIMQDINRKHAKTLQCKDVEESLLSSIKTLGNVKYEVVVVTADTRGSGTDANVSITLFGTHGDTGKRALTQKFRDLFERNQTDKFTIEAIDLGELTKIQIEHDNAGFGADWCLDRVEVTNTATSHSWSFPCGQWLAKNKGDGSLSRELFPRS